MQAKHSDDTWPMPAELSGPMVFPKGVSVEGGGRPAVVSFIRRGRVRLLVQNPGARDVRLVDLSAGATLGVAAAILEAPLGFTMVVLESCEVYSISSSRLRELVESNGMVAAWAARTLAAEVCRIELAVARFGCDAEMRLELHLAELCQQESTVLADGGVRLAVVPSHAEIAQAVGVSREYVGRLLVDAERRGAIRRVRGRYVVPGDSPVLALRNLSISPAPVRQQLSRL